MDKIAVIGAGTMGEGIAHLAAAHGCTVQLIDVNQEILHRALASISQRLDRSVQKGKTSSKDRAALLGRIKPGRSIDGLSEIQFAVEAVVENLEIKHTVFKQLEQAAGEGVVLATNTSSLPVSRIADAVANPSRVVGMHFFNPAPVMPLVEIIAGEKSDPASINFAFDAARSWGKTPVRAKDTPGFIVNRVARGFYLEALRLLGEGVAGVDEIDLVMRTHGKFRMGPFELMDLVGLDVNLAVSTSVWEQMDHHARFTPHEIQQDLVAQGHLGRKTGRGFYVYDGDAKIPTIGVNRRNFDLSPLLSDSLLAFCHRAGASEATATEQYIFARILAAVVNEAGLAYSQGVASSDDIDTAMIKGTNYPNGPLAWGDEIGHRTVRGVLKCLNELAGDGRYQPAPLFADA